jgi:hypothetical protein
MSSIIEGLTAQAISLWNACKAAEAATDQARVALGRIIFQVDVQLAGNEKREGAQSFADWASETLPDMTAKRLSYFRRIGKVAEAEGDIGPDIAADTLEAVAVLDSEDIRATFQILRDEFPDEPITRTRMREAAHVVNPEKVAAPNPPKDTGSNPTPAAKQAKVKRSLASVLRKWTGEGYDEGVLLAVMQWTGDQCDKNGTPNVLHVVKDAAKNYTEAAKVGA